MDVVPLLVFCSLLLAGAGVVMFLYSVRNREPEHMDRLSLLPLEEDAPPREESSPGEEEDGAGLSQSEKKGTKDSAI